MKTLNKLNIQRIVACIVCVILAFSSFAMLLMGSRHGKKGVLLAQEKQANYTQVGANKEIVGDKSIDDTIDENKDSYYTHTTVWNDELLNTNASAKTKQLNRDDEQELPYLDTTITVEDDWTKGQAFAKGNLYFELENKVLQPLVFTRVELWDQDIFFDDWLAMTYTDSSGYFYFEFNNQDSWPESGCDLFLVIYAESYTLQVAGLSTLLRTYAGRTQVMHWNVNSGQTYTMSTVLHYDDGRDFSKAFYVMQGMVVGQRFAMQQGMPPTGNKKLRVIYPFPANTSFCYYEPNADLIIELVKAIINILIPGSGWLLELLDMFGSINIHAINGVSGIGSSDFNKWDTLSHEYGHYVEGIMGNYGSNLLDIITNNPSHYSNTDHFVDKPNKQFAMNLTWSESWATAFSFVAQDYYKDEYLNVPYAGDTYDGDPNGYNKIDYETFTVSNDGNSGEAQEDAVIALLWDLFDDGDEEGDNIALGHAEWWKATTRRGTYTLTDLANNMDNYYPRCRSEFGEIMGLHRIAPSEFEIINKPTLDIPPTLMWEVGGSNAYPNNKFDVFFNNGNQISFENNFRASRYETYAIPLNIWKNVINIYGADAVIDISINAYNTAKYPISGAYRSKSIVVDLAELQVQHMSRSDSYVERVFNLGQGQVKEFFIDVEGALLYSLQTFGDEDTKMYIYDNNNNLIKSDDDSGYNYNAMIVYTFIPKTVYKIKLEFYSTSQSGDIRWAIMPINAMGGYPTTYDTIPLDNEYSNGYSNVLLNGFTVMPTRLKISVDKTLHLRGEADRDVSVYLIDPSSSMATTQSATSPSVVAYSWDTRVGFDPLEWPHPQLNVSSRAVITKQLSANTDYLVIFSARNNKEGYFNLLYW